MKLELKQIVGYLPYGLKVFYMEDIYDVTLEDEMDSFSICLKDVLEGNHKPLFRPLSDLEKEINVNGEKFIPISKMEGINFNISLKWIKNDVNSIPNYLYEKLQEWNFDVKGLIEKGLAIDINTLQQ